MSTPKTPSAPDPAKSYAQGIQIYLKNLPTMLKKEQQARETYDPQRIEEQQRLQDLYGPNQYNQQLQALNQLDPEGQSMRNLLGYKIGTALDRGYIDPQQAAAYRALGQRTT